METSCPIQRSYMPSSINLNPSLHSFKDFSRPSQTASLYTRKDDPYSYSGMFLLLMSTDLPKDPDTLKQSEA